MECPFTQPPARFCDEVPCFLEDLPEDIYDDSTDLAEYRRRYEAYLGERTIYDSLLLEDLKPGQRVLSVGEGTGEYILSRAATYPHLRFYAFDLVPNRMRIAAALAESLGLTNIVFYIGSVEFVPFPDGFFSGAIERGVIHVLPRALKESNLRELERVCTGPVILGWVPNIRLMLLRCWIGSLLLRDWRIWREARFGVEEIEKDSYTVKSIARIVERVTGHRATVLSYYRGGRESDRCRSHHVLQHKGGIIYRAGPACRDRDSRLE